MASRLNPWILVPAAAAVAWAVGRTLRGPAHPYPPAAFRGITFAAGGHPIWPIAPRSRHSRKYEVPYRDVNGKWHGNMARAFKASRGERFHAGVDLYANGGDVVLAPENGVIVGRQPFLNGTGAMLVQLDSGIVVLLGETAMGGAAEFGVDVGARVRQGQPLTRVGVTNSGSHMLHLETYRAGTRKNTPWYKNRPAPAALLDPTDWLLLAKANTVPQTVA